MKGPQLSSLVIAAALVFSSVPPRLSVGQGTVPPAPRDTQRAKPDVIERPVVVTEELTRRLDSLDLKTAELKEQTVKMRRNSAEIERYTRKLITAAKKADSVATNADSVDKDPDTVFLEKEKLVEAVDSAMLGKTWFQQLGVHISRCRFKYILRPKMWGKGKF